MSRSCPGGFWRVEAFDRRRFVVEYFENREKLRYRHQLSNPVGQIEELQRSAIFLQRGVAGDKLTEPARIYTSDALQV